MNDEGPRRGPDRPPSEESAKRVAHDDLVEVRISRGYVLQSTGRKALPGEIVSLSADEAKYVIKKGIGAKP